MNIGLNPHYDLKSPINRAEIDKVEAYDKAFKNQDAIALEAFEKEVLDGKTGYDIGTKVNSPWGENTVIEAHIGPLGADKDVIKKEIVVKSGFMLSLQRHRGREEKWIVTSGILTVISDGNRIEVPAGHDISLPKGNIHCMINAHDEPVTVIEIQKGTCREADNVRLIDFNNRTTYPLKSLIEAQSAIIYSQIHAEIEQKFGCKTSPNPALMSPDYIETISGLKNERL